MRVALVREAVQAAVFATGLLTAGAASAQDGRGRNCLESGGIAELALCIAGALGAGVPEPSPPPGGMCRKRGVTEEELLEPPPMV